RRDAGDGVHACIPESPESADAVCAADRMNARLCQPADGCVIRDDQHAPAALPRRRPWRVSNSGGFVEGPSVAIATATKFLSGIFIDLSHRAEPLAVLGYGRALSLLAMILITVWQ